MGCERPGAEARARHRGAAPDGGGAARAGALFMLWELSTPFVFARWLLHALGRHESRLYIANGVAMIVVFFLCRNLLGAGAAQPQAALHPRRVRTGVPLRCAALCRRQGAPRSRACGSLEAPSVRR